MSEDKHDSFFDFIMVMGGAPFLAYVLCPFCDHVFDPEDAEHKGDFIYRCPNCGKEVALNEHQ